MFGNQIRADLALQICADSKFQCLVVNAPSYYVFQRTSPSSFHKDTKEGGVLWRSTAMWIRRSSVPQILITDDLQKTALPIWTPNLEDGSGDKMLNKWVILGAYPNIVFQFSAHLKAEIHGYLVTKCSYMVSKSAQGRIFEFWKKQQKKKKKKKTCTSKHVWANRRQHLLSIRWAVLSKYIFHFLLAYGFRI